MEGDLDEEIYIKLPKGLSELIEVPKDHFGKLNKAIYGLVQAARQFYAKMAEFLVSLGFTKSKTDPCLFKTNTVIILLYVDDILMSGNNDDLDRVIKSINEEFKIRKSHEVDKFIGVQLDWQDGGTRLIMHQAYIIDRLINNFGVEIQDLKVYKTPAATMAKVNKIQEHEAKLDNGQQDKYRTGVGTLLYLVKYSRPDIANITRELSKNMQGASEGNYKMLLRVIKYITDSRFLGIEYHPDKTLFKDKWELISYVDSDWAGDVDTRRSVTGWCIFLNGCLISWGSRGQQNVTLSSSEAEYVGVSEISKEILFIKQVMEFMDLIISFPVIVHVDNIGAIYMTKGQEGKRTKHIDARYHFVREYVEDGVLKILYVKSEENMADPYTKNTSEIIFDKHFSPYMKSVSMAG